MANNNTELVGVQRKTITHKKSKRSRNASDIDYINSYGLIRKHILNEDTPFAAMEAYKSTRTHLLYTCPGEGPCKKIAFTSVSAHEGKTLTCINLAVSLAQIGKRVLIIDADLRRPTLNDVFELNETQGLSELLAGISKKGCNDSIRVFACKTRYENLAVLPAGNIPPNPAELLSTSQLHNIFAVLENYFDFIFIDSPPIGVVSDTALLIPEVQGHVFVVRAGEVRFEGVRRELGTMKQLGANILGFVLNDYNPKKGLKNYARYGYLKKYGYSGYAGYSGYSGYSSYAGYNAYGSGAERNRKDKVRDMNNSGESTYEDTFYGSDM